MGLFDFLKKKEEPKAKVTVKMGIQTADRSHYANTDYAKAVFLKMLSYKAQPILENPSHYPGYLEYRLGITDPIAKHKELIKTGYVRKASPMEVLDTYKVPELKKLLEDHGIDSKGRKRADLLQKIQGNIDLNALSLPVLYCVSEKGLDFMEKHDDLIRLFGNNYAISLEEYQAAKEQAKPGFSYNDIVWGILNTREADRNNALYRAQFLQSENRLVDSLSWYLTVIYYDANQDYTDELAPAVVKEVLGMKEHYRKEMIERCFRRAVLRNKIITNASFAKLISDLLNEKEINLKNYR